MSTELTISQQILELTRKKVAAGEVHPSRTRPTKPIRRSKVQMQSISDTILKLVEAEQPMTVRQIYYRLVSNSAIGKTEGEYKQTVCRLLADMRRSGVMPYHWIADNTRWQRKPQTYSSMGEMLHQSQESYRRAIWNSQACNVEIWLEKDALAGVLYDVTAEWDVPLMVTRGYPSLTYLHSCAEAMSREKPTYIYYFGDWDPTGVDIPRKVEKDLRNFARDAKIHFKRVAVTREQIKVYSLPTRPTKKSDTRSTKFKGDSVEVDAIPPTELRRLASDCITRHVDRHEYDQLQRIEKLERDNLATWIERIVNGA